MFSVLLDANISGFSIIMKPTNLTFEVDFFNRTIAGLDNNVTGLNLRSHGALTLIVKIIDPDRMTIGTEHEATEPDCLS